MMQLALVAALLALLIWLGKYVTSRIRGLPPGPLEIPLVGSIPFLVSEARVKLAKMGKKYGGIFMIHFGMTPAVIVTDGNLIRDVLVKQGFHFEGRPDFFPTTFAFNRSGVAFAYSKHWKETKAFTKNLLNKFGYIKNTIEPTVSEAAQKAIEELTPFDSRVIKIQHNFYAHVLGITWNMITGKNFSSDDPKIVKLEEDMFKVFRFAQPITPLNFFPFLHFIFPNSFYYKVGVKASEDIDKMIEEEIRTYSKEGSSDEPQNFIEAYLQEIHRRKEHERIIPYDMNTLAYIVKDLIFGGSDTSNNTIKWTMLYLIYFQDVQRKVQDELDREIGPNRFPCYTDRYVLPYTTAVIMEVSRIVTVVPFAAPYQCTKPSKVGKYNIPVGMIIYPHLWALHHDPDIWGDPEEFRPERFIGEDGKIIEPDFYLPFGAGPRGCIGMNFGKLVTFLFISSVFQRFEVSAPPGGEAQDPRRVKPSEGLTLLPPPFSVVLRKRISVT